MIEPAGTQRLEATPSIADADGDAEEISELTIEVGEVTLRMMDDADRQICQAREPLGEHSHDDTLSGSWVSMNEREPPFTQMRLLDAPAEVLDLSRDVQRLDGDLRDEGVIFQAVQSQQFLVHAGSSGGVGK